LKREAAAVYKLENSESFYHSLLHDVDDDGTPRYEGVDQTTAPADGETTHMSWDEVGSGQCFSSQLKLKLKLKLLSVN